MHLLDTNVISELKKATGGKADKGVVSWASSVPANTLFISAITVLELELGVLSIERRDSAQGDLLRAWLNSQVIPSFANRVLPVDSAVAIRCAALQVPNPRFDRDALIAATALVHGMSVVTRNEVDFKPTGARIINPWKLPA